jgi:hypothetical protein
MRGLLVTGIVAVAALAVAQPALAAIQLSQTGTVGAHSLTDTSDNPAAIGKYRYYASDGFGWLTRFYVNPPSMRPVAGMSSQTVGWRFTVERKICGIGGCGRWKATYTSPEMTAVADAAHDAAFSQATVSVRVPCGHLCEDAGAVYRITEKLIWHRGDGSTQGTVRMRVYWYGARMTTGETGVQEKVASDSWSPDW